MTLETESVSLATTNLTTKQRIYNMVTANDITARDLWPAHDLLVYNYSDVSSRQADENSSLGDFLRNLVFGIWLLFCCLFGFGSAKTVLWACFSLRKIFVGWFSMSGNFRGVRYFRVDPYYKQYYRTVWYHWEVAYPSGECSEVESWTTMVGS